MKRQYKISITNLSQVYIGRTSHLDSQVDKYIVVSGLLLGIRRYDHMRQDKGLHICYIYTPCQSYTQRWLHIQADSKADYRCTHLHKYMMESPRMLDILSLARRATVDMELSLAVHL